MDGGRDTRSRPSRASGEGGRIVGLSLCVPQQGCKGGRISHNWGVGEPDTASGCDLGKAKCGSHAGGAGGASEAAAAAASTRAKSGCRGGALITPMRARLTGADEGHGAADAALLRGASSLPRGSGTSCGGPLPLPLPRLLPGRSAATTRAAGTPKCDAPPEKLHVQPTARA